MAKVYTYSGIRYNSPTASQVDFALTTSGGDNIPYLEKAHIHVYTKDDGEPDSSYTEITRGSGSDEWDFKSDDPKVVRFVTAPGAGKDVLLRRETPYKVKYTTFQEGSLLTSAQLNDGEDFSMYVDQELNDNNSDLVGIDKAIDTHDQKAGTPAWEDHDDAVATVGAISERLDTYVQDAEPAAPSGTDLRQAGKFWIDRDDVKLYYWDAAASTPAWVQLSTTGQKGDAATITVGTTQTVNWDQDAEVTNSGSTSAAVFDFKIPKGEPGTAGEYMGKVDATASGTDPGGSQKNGQWWINTTAGSPGWADMASSADLKKNDRLIWNGTSWDVVSSDIASADWAETDTSKTSFIENKPKTVWGQDIGTAAADNDVNGDMTNVGDVTFAAAQEIVTSGTNTSITIKATGSGKVISERDIEIQNGKKLEMGGSTSGTVSFVAPATVAGNYTWPASAPTENRVLQSDDTGALSWVNPASASGQSDWTEKTSTEADFIKNKPPSVWGQDLIVSTAISGPMSGVGDITFNAADVTIASGDTTNRNITISASGTGSLFVQRAASFSENVEITGGKQLIIKAGSGTGESKFELGTTNATFTYKLPTANPQNNNILQCQSNGTMAWVAPSTAAGVNDTTITFTAGDGLNVGSTDSFTTNTSSATTIDFSVDIPANAAGGLAFSSDELVVDVGSDAGLEVRSTGTAATNGVRILLPGSSGLTTGSTGLSIDLHDTTPCLELDSTGIGVLLNGTTLEATATGLRVSTTYNAPTATSAAQLTTSRDIWGQGFNGTADVTGNMSSVGNITFNNADIAIDTGADTNDITIGGAINDGELIIERDVVLGAGASIGLTGSANGNNEITFTPHSNTAASDYILPASLPGAGTSRLLECDDAGNLSWVAAGGTGTVTSVGANNGLTTSIAGNAAITGTGTIGLANIGANTVLGNNTGAADTPAATQVQTDMVADDAITYAKMQDLGTGNRVLGGTAAGAIQEVQVDGNMIESDVALGGNPTTTTQAAGNNTTRIATTAFVTNALTNVTGFVELTPGNAEQTINSGTSSEVLEFVSTADGATGATLTVRTDSSSPADDDVIGRIDFEGENDNNDAENYARLDVVATDVSDGTEDAEIRLSAVEDGTLTERLRVGGGTVQINGNNINQAGVLGFRNLIVNGDHVVTQRGSTTSTTSGYGCDMWQLYFASGEASLSRIDISGAPPTNNGPVRALRLRNESVLVQGGTYRDCRYRFESRMLRQCGWDFQEPTDFMVLSFWVRASVAGTYYGYMRVMPDETVSGADRVFSFQIDDNGADLTADTWTYCTVVVPGDGELNFGNNSNESIRMAFAPYLGTNQTDATVTVNTWRNWNTSFRTPPFTSAAGSWIQTEDATFDIAAVQFERGSVPTNFEYTPYDVQFDRSRRYCTVFTCRRKSENMTTWSFPTRMRATPTCSSSFINNIFRDSFTLTSGNNNSYTLTFDAGY